MSSNNTFLHAIDLDLTDQELADLESARIAGGFDSIDSFIRAATMAAVRPRRSRLVPAKNLLDADRAPFFSR